MYLVRCVMRVCGFYLGVGREVCRYVGSQESTYMGGCMYGTHVAYKLMCLRECMHGDI